MAFVKIFSGSEIWANALSAKLEATGINTVVKNNIQSTRGSSFGQAVEVFVEKNDIPKAEPLVEDFRMNL